MTQPALDVVASSTEHRLGLLTRGEVRRRVDSGAVVVLPTGSLEQHGMHLPLMTDALLAETVCLRAAERSWPVPDVLVAPPLWTGFSPHHLRFGATVTVSGETYVQVVSEVVDAIRTWAPRLLLVNGHGGNRGPLLTVALASECPLVSYWELAATEIESLFPTDASIGHAGEAETAMMLHAFAGLVREPSASFERPADRELTLPELGESGVIGDPTAASAEAGRVFMDAVTISLANQIGALFSSERKES